MRKAEFAMLILDVEQKTEAPTLDRLLRDWWTRLWAWLRREALVETRVEESADETDRSGSLIL
jgi:hypothetical protein